jgi:hypothetical protein
VHWAADTLGVSITDPPPAPLARSATSAVLKLREAELDVHDLGEDPRAAVAETLQRHGVVSRPNGDVAPLIRLSDAVAAACKYAAPEMRKKTETTGRLVSAILGDIPLEDLEAKAPELIRTLSRLPKTHGKAHGRNRFKSDGPVKSKLDEIREADERDQSFFDELAADPDLSEADRRARLVDRMVPRMTINNLKRHLDRVHRFLHGSEPKRRNASPTLIAVKDSHRTLDNRQASSYCLSQYH